MSGLEATESVTWQISIPVIHGTLWPMDFWTPPRFLNLTARKIAIAEKSLRFQIAKCKIAGKIAENRSRKIATKVAEKSQKNLLGRGLKNRSVSESALSIWQRSRDARFLKLVFGCIFQAPSFLSPDNLSDKVSVSPSRPPSLEDSWRNRRARCGCPMATLAKKQRKQSKHACASLQRASTHVLRWATPRQQLIIDARSTSRHQEFACKTIRRESSGGMERLGVWDCHFWGSDFSDFGAWNLAKIALSAEFQGFSWKFRPLKILCSHFIRHQSMPPISAGRTMGNHHLSPQSTKNRKCRSPRFSVANIGPAPLKKCVGDFCCTNFGGFCRGFPGEYFWALFTHKNRDKKSGV